jgi:hypothetical protein
LPKTIGFIPDGKILIYRKSVGCADEIFNFRRLKIGWKKLKSLLKQNLGYHIRKPNISQ